MTILFCEGFENYAAAPDHAGIWSAANSVTYQQAGRDASGLSVALNSAVVSLTHQLDSNEVSGVAGFAFKHNTSVSSAVPLFALLEDSAVGGFHLRLVLTTAETIQLQRSATVLATSAKTLAPGVWYYIEVKWLINNAVGTCQVSVNGKLGGWINFGPGDTQNGGDATVDGIIFAGLTNLSGGDFHFDDVYVLNLLGSAPGNDRLGDSIVETLNPNAAGAEAQWTPSAGLNFQNVDEATPDDDTTFNSSQTVDDDDRFAMDDLVNVPSTVFGVQVQGHFRLENSGLRSLRLKAFDGVTEGQSGDFNPSFSPTFAMEAFMFEDHPSGAAAWSTAEVNAMEAGYRIQS